MLVGVFKKYRELGADLSPLEEVFSPLFGCEKDRVWENLNELLAYIMPLQALQEIGMDENTCAEFAASVMKNQQRLLANNPVAMDERQITSIYVSCL